MSEMDRITAERDALKRQMEDGEIKRAIYGSAFVRDRLTVHPELVAATFGKHFSIESGRVVAKDANGAPMLSRTKLGEPAEIDEALALLVERSGFGDRITKASGASGGGAVESARAGGQQTVSRAAFDSMSPNDRMGFIRAGGRLTD